MKLCSLVDTTVSEDRSECRRADRGSALQAKEGDDSCVLGEIEDGQ